MPAVLLTLVALATGLAMEAVRPPLQPATATDSLRARVAAGAAQGSGAHVGVAFHDLETGDSLAPDPDDSFHATSTMKMPVMIELLSRVDAGTLDLEQGILLANHLHSIVDGSRFGLDPAVDSAGTAYGASARDHRCVSWSAA